MDTPNMTISKRPAHIYAGNNCPSTPSTIKKMKMDEDPKEGPTRSGAIPDESEPKEMIWYDPKETFTDQEQEDMFVKKISIDGIAKETNLWIVPIMVETTGVSIHYRKIQ
ncbi:hypothetical protein H4219_000220, partial [Mycoemilia scoparia]